MPRHRSRSRERNRHHRRRSSSRSRLKSTRNERSRPGKQERGRDYSAWESTHQHGVDNQQPVKQSTLDMTDRKRPREGSSSPKAVKDAEDDAKRRRLERLEAWKTKQAAQSAAPPPKETPASQLSGAWVPWDDPTPAVDLARPPVPDAVQRKRTEAALRDIEAMAAGAKGVEVDPLDAFMASEVMPEVQAKEEEEKKRASEEKAERLKLLAEGRQLKRPTILDDSDSEEEADLELQIPANKVKLMIGPNGTKIQEIQKKSKCRIQVKKDDAEMNRAFGSGPHISVSSDGKPKMVTIMLFGDARGVECAEQLINEAVENRDQKQKQRHKEYERKREAKIRERQIYHLRHARDYEALGVPLGTSKADVKIAYRKLAVKWHPDKHPGDKEAAKNKFQEIQAAYQSLMMSNEDERVEQIGV